MLLYNSKYKEVINLYTYRKYDAALKPFSLRLTLDLKQQIEEIAKKQNKSQNDIIIEAATMFLNQEETNT